MTLYKINFVCYERGMSRDREWRVMEMLFRLNEKIE